MGRYINSIAGLIAVTLVIATVSAAQEASRQPELLAPVPKIQLDSNAYRATAEESKAIGKLMRSNRH
jgi:hypothetical protein